MGTAPNHVYEANFAERAMKKKAAATGCRDSGWCVMCVEKSVLKILCRIRATV